jgi:Flp pilus assembly protein TadG
VNKGRTPMSLRQKLSRFARDKRGAFAMQFALMVTPLVICTGLAIDGGRTFLTRFELASSLDAAALAVGSVYDPEVDEEALAQAFVDRNFRSAGTGDVTVDLVESDDGETLTLTGSVTLSTFFMPLIGMPYVEVGAESEVKRGGANVEVTMILDTTGSMAGQRIIDLKEAAKDLIDIVIADDQSVWYSRIGIVPYSNSVYAGSRAQTVRGSIPSAKSITNAIWRSGTELSSVTFDAGTDTFSKNGHGYANGDYVFVRSMTNNSSLNNKAWKVSDVTANTFRLKNAADAYYTSGSNGSSGRTQECLNDWCEVTITANNHGFSNNQWIHITSVGGITNLNNKSFQVRAATSNTLILTGSLANNANYTSGGSAWCAQYGCQYYRFTTANGAAKTLQASECVVERTGDEAYTNAPPSTAYVTIHYPDPSDSNMLCETDNVLRTLSDDKETLKANIDDLNTGGSTAGHIGLAWGWYMLSPSWNTVFNGAAHTAGQYDEDDLLKVAVMMTDGEFNTAYCNGVLSNDSSYSDNSRQINCNAPNGTPFSQAAQICDAMKGEDIVIYTVGFQVATNGGADSFLEDCATSSDFYYNASNGAELQEAFEDIAQSITMLRLSR